MICGDKMGLDTFLSDREALAFGRSLGSGPWLFPANLPPGVPSTFYFHPQGILEVRVTSPIRVKRMLKDRRAISKTKKFKLSLVYNDNVATTDYHVSENGSVLFDETFCFATGPDGVGSAKGSSDLFQILLLEPGVSASKHEKDNRSCCRKLLCLPFQILCLFPILFFCMVKHVTILSAEAVSRAVGGSTILAVSKPINVSGTLQRPTIKVRIKLYYGDDRDDMDGGGFCRKKPSPEEISVTMKYTPPARLKPNRRKSKIAIKDNNTSDPELADDRVDCADLLEREGLDDILSMVENVYDTDPVGPRSRSSTEAPPVKRIKAIYGKNLRTEVGAIYRRRPAAIERNTENRYELDTDAKLSKRDKSQGLKLKGGVLYETDKRKQADGCFCSGDGTGMTKNLLVSV